VDVTTYTDRYQFYSLSLFSSIPPSLERGKIPGKQSEKLGKVGKIGKVGKNLSVKLEIRNSLLMEILNL